MIKKVGEKYFSGKYTYTPLFPELEKVLGKIKAKIVGNLLYKLYTLGGKYKYDGKDYQFYRQKKYIAENELNMDYSNFNKQINDLEQGKYLTTFPARIGGKHNPQINANEGYNTTCFTMNLETIDAAFEEGAKLLGKKEKDYIQRKRSPPKQPAKMRTSPIIDGWLNEIDNAYNQFKNKEMSEMEYKEIFNKVNKSFQRNGMTLPDMYNLKNKNYE